MTLRTRTFLIVVPATLVLAAFFALSFTSKFMHDFERIERDQLVAHVERVNQAIDRYRAELERNTIDWAQWDEPYRYMEDRNESYIQANYVYETLAAVNIAVVLIYDTSGTLIRGIELDNDSQRTQGASASVLEAVDSFPNLKNQRSKESSLTGFIRAGNRWLLVAAAPIIDSKREHEPRGTLVLARSVTSALQEEIAAQTRLNVRFKWQLDEGTAPATASVGPSPTIETVSDDTILAMSPLFDLRGSTAGNFVVEHPRRIFSQGKATQSYVLTSIVLTGGFFLILLLFLLNRFVLARLTALSADVSNIALKQSFSQRVRTEGNDEVANLAVHVNHLLEAVEKYYETLRQTRQLEEANEAKSAFIAKVSHELRTPLNGIMGMFRIVLRANLAPEIRDYLRKAQDAASGLLGIINDILDFSKFASHSIVLENVPCAFRHTICDVLNLVGPKVYEKRDLELTAHLDPRLPDYFLGDPLRMNQILVNLVGNAVKFTSRGYVHLDVSLSDDGQTIAWKITDTGCGIPGDRLPTIFEPFSQADNTTTRRYSGTGLGLTITKQIVDALGGDISIQSKENVGSTFTVQIPLRIPEGGPTIVPQPLRVTDTVLIVEDCHFGDFVETSIRGAGANVTRVNASNRATHVPLKEDTIVFIDGRVLELSVYQNLITKLVEAGYASRIAVFLPPTNADLLGFVKEKQIEQLLLKPVSSLEVTRILYGQTDAARAESDHYEAESALRNLKLRVLMAEDVLLNQLVLKQMLEDNGFVVSAVEDGEALVRELRPTLQARAVGDPGDYDLVLTDLHMPNMDGVEATGCIRTIEQSLGGCHYGPIVIIAITGNVFVEEHAKLYSAGIDAVITKPINPRELWQNIRVKVREKRIHSNTIPLLPQSASRTENNAERLLQQASVAIEAILESNQRARESVQKVYKAYLEDLSYHVPETIDHKEMKNLFFAYTPLFDQVGYRPQTINAVMEMFLRDYDKLLGALNDAQSSHDKEQLRKAIHSLKGSLAQAGCRLGEKIAEIAEREAYSDFYRAASYAGHLDPITRAFAQVVETFMAEQTKTAGFVAG